MKKIFIYLISIFLLIASPPSSLMAQSKYLPSAIRIGTDLTKLGQTLIDEEKTVYEFHADIDVHKYFLVFDYGTEESTRLEEEFTYFNEGSYFRYGIDHNFKHHNKDPNVLAFGIRYAETRFNDQLDYFVGNEVWGDNNLASSNKEMKGTWFEITGSLKARIWKQLYLGYTVRFKFAFNIDGVDNYEPFSAPGFGRADGPTNIGLNYHIFYRIPFRKKEVKPQKSIQ